ncbi:MAG TPA: AAA family ATPase [archaeon]|nr:AAA family ATPase [archaeon]
MLIGLTSRNAAGKDEVARFLCQRHGFSYFSLSDVLREELKIRGLPVTRENLIEAGNALRLEKGPGALAEIALESLRDEQNAVVVSIRNPGEVEALRRRKDFILVGVDAPAGLRYQRARARGRTDDAATLEDFISQEKAEIEGSENEQQLDRCFRMSERVIVNDGTLEELYAKVEELL